MKKIVNDASYLKHLNSINKEIINKWEKTGFLDDIKEEHEGIVAVILENQIEYMLRHPTSPHKHILLPIVRRIIGKLLERDDISIQPLTHPSGPCFFEKNGKLKSLPVTAFSRIVNLKFPAYNHLDEEIEICHQVSDDFLDQFNKQFDEDLKNHPDHGLIYCPHVILIERKDNKFETRYAKKIVVL